MPRRLRGKGGSGGGRNLGNTSTHIYICIYVISGKADSVYVISGIHTYIRVRVYMCGCAYVCTRVHSYVCAFVHVCSLGCKGNEYGAQGHGANSQHLRVVAAVPLEQVIFFSKKYHGGSNSQTAPLRNVPLREVRNIMRAHISE